MVPIGIAEIKPDAYPAVAEIGGAVITVFVAVDQHRLFLDPADFYQKRGLVVAMMVDRDIGELLAADDAEAGHAMGRHLVRFGLRQRAFADLRHQPFGICVAGHISGECPAVELMFGKQDAGRKGRGCIAGQYGHFGLAQYWSAIQFRRYQMHAASGHFVTRVQRPLMGVQPLIFGQERRVDIQHPAFPLLHKSLAQYPHISGKRYMSRARFHYPRVHDGLVRRPVHALVRVGKSRNAFALRQF